MEVISKWNGEADKCKYWKYEGKAMNNSINEYKWIKWKKYNEINEMLIINNNNNNNDLNEERNINMK